MQFRPPAGIDDLSTFPQLREKLLELWNSDDPNNGFVGAYVLGAEGRSPNYVDPRKSAPVTEPVTAPWNGFPRTISRWYDDELSDERKGRAEATADIATPILSWVQPNAKNQPALFQIEQHRVDAFGEVARALARPLRQVLPDGKLGAEVPQLRRQQDEYLEWHAARDTADRLTALTFTAEPPDYWNALALVAPDQVLKLYRDLLNADVKKDDIFHAMDLAAFGIDETGQPQWFNIGGKDTYNDLNSWTTTNGIIHLTHRANTLGAEVTLAADASVIWASDFEQAVDPQDIPAETRRIACGSYGGINRSSDPLIGQRVASVVLGGSRVTLTDPIGLYVATIDLAGLRGPQGQPVGNKAVTILRGDNDPFSPRILRFVVKLPEGLAFGLDECTLDGRALTRGGQVARKTTMHLYAQGYPDSADKTAQDCQGKPCEHPQRKGLFIGVGLDETCPKEDDLAWLSETPFEALPMAMVHATASTREKVTATLHLKARKSQRGRRRRKLPPIKT